jgi:hypothetical protein
VNKCVKFGFEVEFTNGGGIQGQGFRLDIDGKGVGTFPVRAMATFPT